MKRAIISIFMFGMIGISGKTQNLRYFEFTTQCGHGNWQDTSFIAATSVGEVIDSVLADLSRPYDQRKFIIGPIAGGHGGHNRNAGHWFSWHFIPDQWNLTEMAIELCDGCPYSDIDADTSYWLHTVRTFCPWSGKPVREVSRPTGMETQKPLRKIQIYPNPATSNISIKLPVPKPVYLTVFSATGQALLTMLVENNETMDISHLQEGIYLLHFYNDNISITEKLIRMIQ